MKTFPAPRQCAQHIFVPATAKERSAARFMNSRTSCGSVQRPPVQPHPGLDTLGVGEHPNWTMKKWSEELNGVSV
jgi:hypothetical protein